MAEFESKTAKQGSENTYTVKALAKMSGVSVRTLHHYDEIGLLRPAARNAAGYRLYSGGDAAKLQEVLFFRELGFSLEEIRGMLRHPEYERRAALLAQKTMLREKAKRLNKMARVIDKILFDGRGRNDMATDELFGGLDSKTLDEYQKEARERWGGTDAYKESERKTARYNKEDWERINKVSGDIYTKIADLMDAGAKPTDARVQVETKRWYEHITDSFYTCTPEIFRGLAEGYVADKRFTDNIDGIRPGLAVYLKDAMIIYANSVSSNAEA